MNDRAVIDPYTRTNCSLADLPISACFHPPIYRSLSPTCHKARRLVLTAIPVALSWGLNQPELMALYHFPLVILHEETFGSHWHFHMYFLQANFDGVSTHSGMMNALHVTLTNWTSKSTCRWHTCFVFGPPGLVSFGVRSIVVLRDFSCYQSCHGPFFPRTLHFVIY